MRKFVAPLALVLAVLAGLPDLAVSAPRPGIARAAAELHPCPNIRGAKCGSIELPLDPRHLDLGTTNVGFLRYPRRKQDLPSLGYAAEKFRRAAQGQNRIDAVLNLRVIARAVVLADARG